MSEQHPTVVGIVPRIDALVSVVAAGEPLSAETRRRFMFYFGQLCLLRRFWVCLPWLGQWVFRANFEIEIEGIELGVRRALTFTLDREAP